MNDVDRTIEPRNNERLLTTKEAARLMRRKPQTLRVWSMTGSSPIHPVRTRPGAPLLWRLSEIERFIAGGISEAAV